MIVTDAGPLTTVQDLGRPGYAHLGVSRSGALDQPALLLANRLVGNPPGAAGLEITLGPFAATMPAAGAIALTGAAAPLRVGGKPAPLNAPVAVRAGDRIEIGPAVLGLRAYLAVAGGLAVAAVLTSRATDTLSFLGPPVVRTGDRLPIGPRPGEPATVDVAPRPALGGDITLRITWGPHADRFTDTAVLGSTKYTIGNNSNRVGARLDGRPLTPIDGRELPSEGIVLGAVQVPADGRPLVFLADHPTTGGYPVVAVVDPVDLPLLAQARPGDTVRFRGSQL
ncbi:biotin-dependent carboxyltransferase family protein [Dactylosporangium roseum]|uniref:Biotin-dependent carboxyltransferase family protein n=1 Tax=Dactylosporangium roseum TaxID=47989 RepID=A0ABY5Z726_9ACTN|nr:biotin-dependent carboxyltransferase family protein [Dactylosporangium roseum]UWZ36853.1 biotin-dependent carboxyltransferase family protein [Dactylosporangium roseum]